MYKNIFIPVALDHEQNINEMISVAQRLMSDGGKITLVGVVEQVPDYVAEYATVKSDTSVKSHMTERLQAIAAQHSDIEVAILSGKPGVVIADWAETSKADLIIIGSHRPGVQDYFLGSTASRVVRRAPCAVMVLR